MWIDQFSHHVFRSCSGAFTPPATPTDVFTITGNVTTNVYVMKVGISTTQTTAGSNEWMIGKRSTANSGGTHTAPNIVAFNSNYSASATVALYSANPTTGTLVGNVWDGFIVSPAVATSGEGNCSVEIDFQSLYGCPIELLSASQVLALNFNGAALPAGLSVIAWVHWFEQGKT